MSNRKPFNCDAGYVCSRRSRSGGHVVVYDRCKGGDWIDGETRWVVAHYDAERRNDGLLDCSTKAMAISLMKEDAEVGGDWYSALPC